MMLNRVSDMNVDKEPLAMADIPVPKPGPYDVVIKVSACGVCHTELDEIEGRTAPPRYPVVPGHEVVGRIHALGRRVHKHAIGDRVGAGWIFSACGTCGYCRRGDNNLCPSYRATGRDANGGYAEYMMIGQDFAFPIPDIYSDTEAAPLLCAGAIGYRSLALAGISNGMRLGLTGFGASGHLVLKLAAYMYPDSDVYVFARSPKERAFALDLGAVWAGDTAEKSPQRLDAIIDTTPVWKPVVEAMENLAPGGRLVINAIRKENIDKEYLLHMDYPRHLWMEKEIKSVANVASSDIAGFLEKAAAIPIRPTVETYTLDRANEALISLKQGHIRGAKVLVPE